MLSLIMSRRSRMNDKGLGIVEIVILIAAAAVIATLIARLV